MLGNVLGSPLSCRAAHNLGRGWRQTLIAPWGDTRRPVTTCFIGPVKGPYSSRKLCFWIFNSIFKLPDYVWKMGKYSKDLKRTEESWRTIVLKWRVSYLSSHFIWTHPGLRRKDHGWYHFSTAAMLEHSTSSHRCSTCSLVGGGGEGGAR